MKVFMAKKSIRKDYLFGALFFAASLAGILLIFTSIFANTFSTDNRSRASGASNSSIICWNRVIATNNSYSWPTGCKGTLTQGIVCPQVLVTLTSSEVSAYKAWVKAGKKVDSACTTDPTPSPTNCKTGVNSFAVDTSCGKDQYRYVSFTCYGGYTERQGGTTSCKSSTVWSTYAKEACSKRSSCSTATPTPSPKPTPIACPTPPACQPGQQLVTGDPNSKTASACPVYSCIAAPKPTSTPTVKINSTPVACALPTMHCVKGMVVSGKSANGCPTYACAQ